MNSLISTYFFKLRAFLFISCLSASLLGAEYYPPFAQGRSFLVSQGFYGSQSHFNDLNRYAVDLVMPLGELVCAARSGVVMQVVLGRGFVRIQHSDGTVGDYQHLSPDSIQVQERQYVQTRQCFAQIGLIGRSSGPHLHFAILKSKEGKWRSIPFKFIALDGSLYTPKYLQWVRH